MLPLPDVPSIDFKKLEKALANAQGDEKLFRAIVDAPFEELKVEAAFMFLGIIAFLLVNKKTGTIDRIALSKTELAKGVTDVSVKRFEDIKIPVGYKGNIIAEAIETGAPQDTSDWKYLFAPDLTSGEARINQAGAGIGYSAVYPLDARDQGAIIFSYYQYPQDINEAQIKFMEKYTTIVTKALRA
jgi:hypothetical protein